MVELNGESANKLFEVFEDWGDQLRDIGVLEGQFDDCDGCNDGFESFIEEPQP